MHGPMGVLLIDGAVLMAIKEPCFLATILFFFGSCSGRHAPIAFRELRFKRRNIFLKFSNFLVVRQKLLCHRHSPSFRITFRI